MITFPLCTINPKRVTLFMLLMYAYNSAHYATGMKSLVVAVYEHKIGLLEKVHFTGSKSRCVPYSRPEYPCL